MSNQNEEQPDIARHRDVTPLQVACARSRVERDKLYARVTPLFIQKIAEAKRAVKSEANRDA